MTNNDISNTVVLHRNLKIEQHEHQLKTGAEIITKYQHAPSYAVCIAAIAQTDRGNNHKYVQFSTHDAYWSPYDFKIYVGKIVNTRTRKAKVFFNNNNNKYTGTTNVNNKYILSISS